jgi:hypothetical protein
MQLPSGQRDKYQGIRFHIPAGRALPHGVMVFALPENSVINMKFRGRQARWQKLLPPRLCANCTYRRTLGPIVALASHMM